MTASSLTIPRWMAEAALTRLTHRGAYAHLMERSLAAKRERATGVAVWAYLDEIRAALPVKSEADA